MRPGRATLAAHPGSTIQLPLADEDLTIGKSFVYAVQRFGDRPAVSFEGSQWTYSELADEVDRCARALIAAGVGKGTRVGILMGNRPEFIVLAHATAMVGGICVFISTFTTDDELDWIIRHSDTAVLFMHAAVRSRSVAKDFATRHRSVVEGPKGDISDVELPYLRRVVVVPNTDDSLDPQLEQWNDFVAGGGDVDSALVRARCDEVFAVDDAIILYTSGSTSRPKAVLHMHRAPTMQSFNMADCMAIGENDRVFTSFPVFWTAGWVTAVAGPLLVGACTVLQEFYEPEDALLLIEQERVTCIRQMVHDEMRLVAANADHPRDLRTVTVGVVTEGLRALTRVPEDISEICGWGMTETFTNATMLPFDAPYELRLTTMGRPVPGNHIRIRDNETGEEKPANEPGEITVTGMSMMRCYYKADPPSPIDRSGYLPTNDAGYLTDDGLLVFAGRLDRLIKTAGVNVSPIEIEERLLKWGRLGTCAAIGVPHPTLAQAVVLCVARQPSDSVTSAEIRDYLKANLASYKVPRHVEFLEEADFPLTGNSKIHVPELTDLIVARMLAGDIDVDWKATLRAR